MTRSTSTLPRPPLPYAGLTGDVFASARQAAGTAAQTYLAGLDAVLGAQRRFTAGTPFEPASELLGAQVKLTRRVLEGFVTGETPGSPSVVARAAEAAEDVAETAAEAPARAARTTARTARTRKPAASARRTGAAAKRSTASPRSATSRSRTNRAAARALTSAAAAPPAPALPEPLPGYAGLTADQITGRLAELSQAQLGEIRAYETANDARQTVLSRIDALTEPEPLPGYDELTVEDILPRLGDGGAALAGRVLAYERRHKQRAGVIEAAERHSNAE
jgi:hypothetical protein